MKTFHNISLTSFHTFRLPWTAGQMVWIEDEKEIAECVRQGMFSAPFLILSGGSNILPSPFFQGTVFRPAFKGIRVEREANHEVLVSVKAGVVWDDFVAWAVVNDFGGVENLSLIPGMCGTAPVQNIGAFGAEISQILHRVDGYSLPDGLSVSFDASQCKLGYRDSIFKRELHKRFFITSVTFRLTKGNHVYRTEYGNLAERLGDKPFGLSEIRQSVIDIRRSKLPDPQVTGNAGSFFKNPAIPISQAEAILSQYPSVPLYPFGDSHMKIAAGWMIEQCGWKGKRHGGAGVHDRQALVLVNHGNATSNELLELAEMIEKSVQDTFSVTLEREVNVIG